MQVDSSGIWQTRCEAHRPGGIIDNVGNYAADGIVGPHHEKEGSYYTIKQVWSPVATVYATKLNES